MAQRSRNAISAAIFCPMFELPSEECMAEVRRFIRGNPLLQPLWEAILDLPNTWQIFAQANSEIGALKEDSRFPTCIRDWLVNGTHLPATERLPGILSIPLSTIVQLVQYFQYLAWRAIDHCQFLKEVRVGGIQGYCGGLLSAVAIAASRTEQEVVANTIKCLRIALGIGAYGQAPLGDERDSSGPAVLALRAKQPGQIQRVVDKFEKVHISAITTPLSLSVVGPVAELEKVKAQAASEGLLVYDPHIHCSAHNPGNRHLAAELCDLCDDYYELSLPSSSELQVPVRCNDTGNVMSQGICLSHELVTSMLVEQSNWFELMKRMTKNLNDSAGVGSEHVLAIFGHSRGREHCVPPGASEDLEASFTTLDVMTETSQIPPTYNGLFSLSDKAVAIVGVACRIPGANDLDELWDLVASGKSMSQELPLSRANSHEAHQSSPDDITGSKRAWYGNFINNVEEFDHGFFGVSPREAIQMDPQQRVLLETAYQALDSSGYLRQHQRENFDNVGCFIGTTHLEYMEHRTANGTSAYSATGSMRAFQSGKISYHFGWSGPSEVIDTACSSSMVAINRACQALRTKECGMALAGGVNIVAGLQNYLDLGKAGYLSPTGQCKPFDRAADGFCRADGAGVVVLKLLSDAIAEGQQILGVIPAIATNHGSLSPSITTPCPQAQRKLFKDVLQQSGLQARHITFVEAHGPGTQVGDPIEIDSIRKVLGGVSQRDVDEPLYLGSLKANVGHSESAAGIGSLLKVLAMFQHKRIPQLAGFMTLNPEIPTIEKDNLQIPRHAISWEAPFRAAMVNSYGNAGSNAALICVEPSSTSQIDLSEARRVPEMGSADGLDFPIFVSAATTASLQLNVRRLGDYIRTKESLSSTATQGKPFNLGDVAYTLYEKRQHHKFYMVSTTGQDGPNSQVAQTISPSVDTRPVVLVFSGQSAQNIHVEPAWYTWFPRFRLYIDQIDAKLRDLGHSGILPIIFRPEPISDIVALHCGLFAVQYASAKCWLDAGLKVAAVVGHSFGELTAMTVSGALSWEDGLRLVATRASLIRDKWGPEHGAMLAIQAKVETVEEIISSSFEITDVTTRRPEVACYNGPMSQVVVGAESQIEQIEQTLRLDKRFQGIQLKRVDVSHGFHSTFCEPIIEELEQFAKTLTINDPKIPLETCTESPLDSVSPSRIAAQTRVPVYFSQAISRLGKRFGPCIWMEAGVNSPIISMTRRALVDASQHVLISVRTEENKNAITNATTELWRQGVSTSFWSFLTPEECGIEHVWLPPYQFDRSRHWLDWVARHPANGNHMQQQTTSLRTDGKVHQQPSSRLITPTVPHMLSGTPQLDFPVHTTSKRFTTITNSHIVRGVSQCPVSMYMEYVTMAASSITPDVILESLMFKNVSFHEPLTQDSGKVLIRMEEDGDASTWQFLISSSQMVNGSTTSINHCKGQISLSTRLDLQLTERLLFHRALEVLADPNSERLYTDRAYATVSHVLQYEAYLRGIEKIAFLGSHAVAQIRRPSAFFDTSVSTAASSCDGFVLDMFLQVLGLMFNLHQGRTHDDLYVAAEMESFVVLQGCNFAERGETWTVYAMSLPDGVDNHGDMIGDLLVFNSRGKLVVSGAQIRFTRRSIPKLPVPVDVSISTSTATNFWTIPQKHTHDRFSAHDEDIHQVDESLVARQGATIENSSSGTRRESDTSPKPTHTPSSSEASRCNSSNKTEDLSSEQQEESLGSDTILILRRMLTECAGIDASDVSEEATLTSLGLDSLGALEMAEDLKKEFGLALRSKQLFTSTLLQLKELVGGQPSRIAGPVITRVSDNSVESASSTKGLPSGSTVSGRLSIMQNEPLDILRSLTPEFDSAALTFGLNGYRTGLAPLENDIALAYMIEAFAGLGVDLNRFSSGDKITSVPHLPKYDKLVLRFWEILEQRGLVTLSFSEPHMVSSTSPIITRTSRHIDSRPASQLLEECYTKFPSHRNELDVLGLAGPRLADCFSGNTDPVSLFFGRPQSVKIMEDYYSHSPISRALSEQLVIYLKRVVAHWKRPVRILEVGGGTGGTTRWVTAAFEAAGIRPLYTFTDISHNLVKKSKAKFAPEFPWITYTTYNLEDDIPSAFRGEFDIVFATNTVHATRDRVAACCRLRETLVPSGGLVILAELTSYFDWHNVCFALLDGWWLAGGSLGPLQTAKEWMSTFSEAGFDSMGYSSVQSADENVAQLLVGCNLPC